MKSDYQHFLEQKYRDKLERILKDELPGYAKDYFVGTSQVTQPRTQMSYAYDLLHFYRYLSAELFGGKPVKEITLSDLEFSITKKTIEQYLFYAKGHGRTVKGKVQTSSEAAVARKLSCIKGYFKYYFGEGSLSKNVTETVPCPKIPEQGIKYLSPDEVAILLDGIENWPNELPDGQQRRYLEKTKQRDLAIVSLFLGTGMRLSELVGINLKDVNFNEYSIDIHRKGNREETIYFNEEVAKTLTDYIEGSRATAAMAADPNSQDALFFSTRGTRLSARAVEEMVTKYLKRFVPHKHLTVHKLRATFGTVVYRETGDIYAVADALGHKSVEVTRKHYAAQSEENRRKIANCVSLRN